jgi:hypothetical protein
MGIPACYGLPKIHKSIQIKNQIQGKKSTDFKDMISKLTIEFWMCQKCGKMKDYNQKKKMTTSAVE